MQTTYQSHPPAKKLIFGKGEFHIWYPSPTVLLLAAHGHGEAGLAKLVCAEMDEVAKSAGQSIQVFTDDRKLTSYEPAYRAAFEEWLAGCWRSISSIRLLIDSDVVEMGMAVVSMNLGETATYEMYKNFSDWNQHFQEALRK